MGDLIDVGPITAEDHTHTEIHRLGKVGCAVRFQAYLLGDPIEVEWR